jgi:hypothetical protein
MCAAIVTITVEVDFWTSEQLKEVMDIALNCAWASTRRYDYRD